MDVIFFSDWGIAESSGPLARLSEISCDEGQSQRPIRSRSVFNFEKKKSFSEKKSTIELFNPMCLDHIAIFHKKKTKNKTKTGSSVQFFLFSQLRENGFFKSFAY